MRYLLPLLFLSFACTRGDAVAGAKDVIRSHEQFAKAGDLDGVLSNVADDIVLLTPGAPLVQGTAAFRDMYRALFEMGQWDFTHHYDGAAVAGDVIVLHGVARGTLTPAGGQPSAFANNFMLILKPGPDGRFKVWRGAFAPSAP